MVGINLFGFRKFELLRGEGEGGGGGGGPGLGISPGQAQAMGGGLQGGDTVGDPSGADPGFAPDAQFSNEDVGAGAVSANTQNFGVSPAQANAQLGTTSGSTGFDFGATPQADLDAEMGGSLNANAAGFNAAQAQAQADANANAEAAAQAEAESLGFGIEDFGSVTPDVQDDGFNQTSFDAMMGVEEDDNSVTPGFDSLSAQDPSDLAVTDISFNPAELAAATGIVSAGISDPTATGVQDPSGLTVDTTDPVAFAENYISPLADEFGVIDYSSVAKTEAKNKDPNAPVTSDTLYGTSKLTGEQVTAMSPAKARAMTGGAGSGKDAKGQLAGMNFTQNKGSLEAGKQAAAIDVLGAQIGAGNLTGNETIDEINTELAKKGVQIDSGIPGILGQKLDEFNKNYQLTQNQDIISKLAQGTNYSGDTEGILGTNIGAVKGVANFNPLYDASGNIVGTQAVNAAGDTVGGTSGITTNTLGGVQKMGNVYSDADATNLYGDVNEAVDVMNMSQSSDEGPPQDVTSVDANGCVIGAEFFDGQKCSPIGSGTGDGTGGGTGGGFTPYNYQPGQGTMLRPDFSDAFTSNVQFNTLNPNASNMNFLKPAVNPYGNFAGGGIVDMMRNNRYR